MNPPPSFQRILKLVLQLIASSAHDCRQILAVIWRRLLRLLTLTRRPQTRARRPFTATNNADPQHSSAFFDDPTIAFSQQFSNHPPSVNIDNGDETNLAQVEEGRGAGSCQQPRSIQYSYYQNSPFRTDRDGTPIKPRSADDKADSTDDPTQLSIPPQPTTPLQLLWFQSQKTLDIHPNLEFTVDPFETKHRLEPRVIDGWDSFIHPQGYPYFYSNGTHTHPKFKFQFVTKANLYDLTSLNRINLGADLLEQRIAALDLSPEFRPESESNIEIVIEMLDYDSDLLSYYIIDRSTECIFYLDKVQSSLLSYPSMLVQSKHHFQSSLDVQYWTHVQLFPHNKILSPHFWKELQGMLMHGALDTIGDSDSVYPYSSDRMHDLLDIVQTLKSSWDDDDAENDYIISAAAQVMAVFGGKRAVNRFGQHNAKLKRLQPESHVAAAINSNSNSNPNTQHGLNRVRPHGLQHAILTFLMFAAPKTYYSQFRTTNANLVTMEEWVPVFEGIVSDWQQVVVYAAILMNANIAFLAIPSIPSVPGAAADASQGRFSPIEVVCQCSIMLSLSSMIVGLVLIKQYAITENRVSPQFFTFVARWHDEEIGYYAAAFMFSVPYVLLIWSTASFLISLGLLSFSLAGIWQLTLFALVWFCVVVLSTWGMFARTSFSSYGAKVVNGGRRMLCVR